MCYVNSGVFNSGESKNDLTFSFLSTSNNKKGAPGPGGGSGGPTGGVKYNTTKYLMLCQFLGFQ